MAILIDIEWDETCDTTQASSLKLTQVSALRVDNTWRGQDWLSLLVRPEAPQACRWGFMAYHGHAPEAFCSGICEGDCIKALFAWIEKGEKIFYWHSSTRKTLLKVYRRYFQDRERIFDGSRFVCLEERLSAALKTPVDGLYKTAYDYGVEIATNHCSDCDVKLMQQILRKINITAKQLETAPIKTLRLSERRAKNQKTISKMSCTFVYAPKSAVFHRCDCKLILNAKTVMGCVRYATAAKGRRPCKVCRPAMPEAEAVREAEVEKCRRSDAEISKMNEIVKVRLIDGSRIIAKRKKLVGFCHSRIHPGYLNEKLMEEHDCLGKQCRYFEQYENASYWIGKQMRKVEKLRIKQKRQQRQMQEDASARLLETLKKEFQGYMEAENYPVQIIYVELVKANVYKVFYVSDYVFADGQCYPSFYTAAMKCHPGFRLLLRHIKDEDGHFVTREEYIRRVGRGR